jgi:hypothetical protein
VICKYCGESIVGGKGDYWHGSYDGSMRCADGQHLAEPEDLQREKPQRFIARFVPQAWVSDNAIDVDPQGPTEWDCTDVFDTMPSPYRESFIDDIDTFGESLDHDDWLKSDPDAPTWVQNWAGPFSIYVRRKRNADD